MSLSRLSLLILFGAACVPDTPPAIQKPTIALEPHCSDGGALDAEEAPPLDAGTATPADSGPGNPLDAGADGPADVSGPPPALPNRVEIVGRTIRVGGQPFEIKGVGYNPVPKGGVHPNNLSFLGAAAVDIPLMSAAGINVVRTYAPLEDLAVLDQLAAQGIRVLTSVYVYGGEDPSVVTERVRRVKNHPALLGYLVGNEWNYNGLYVGLSHADSLARMQTAARLIHAEDPAHPVATVYGELPSAETLAALTEIDFYGINSYRGLSFGDLFTVWASRSEKPMFLAEYGADAWDARDGGQANPEAQALATTALTNELRAAFVGRGGVVSGGCIFEWADEWWKDGAGSPAVHDIGGIAPGGGPYPDQTFNEEWWGVVDIDRVPRPAYFALQAIWGPGR